MKSIVYVLTALMVFGLAFWAYRENYATQQVLKDTQKLQRQIGLAQLRLNVLRAEWAYLNRPKRLMELTEINFDRLGLLHLRPDQFGRVDEVSYPPAPLLPITNPVDVSTMNATNRREQFP
jgi:cell division protein FtsL